MFFEFAYLTPVSKVGLDLRPTPHLFSLFISPHSYITFTITTTYIYLLREKESLVADTLTTDRPRSIWKATNVTHHGNFAMSLSDAHTYIEAESKAVEAAQLLCFKCMVKP